MLRIYIFNSLLFSLIIALYPVNIVYGNRQRCVEGETRAARGNCHLYAQCVHGRIILRTCPPGTVYDRIAKVCNFPSQVPHQRCFRGCLPSSDFSPSPISCSMFYRCSNGILSVFTCPSGTVFDRMNKICNYPSQVTGRCGIKTTTTTTTTTASSSTSTSTTTTTSSSSTSTESTPITSTSTSTESAPTSTSTTASTNTSANTTTSSNTNTSSSTTEEAPTSTSPNTSTTTETGNNTSNTIVSTTTSA